MAATRLEAVLAMPPFSLAAMTAVDHIRAAAQAAIGTEFPSAGGPAGGAEVLIAGPTAQMMDVRDITPQDFHLVVVLMLAVILIVITALLRDVILTLFMIACTVLSYFATLGLSYWLFAALGRACTRRPIRICSGRWRCFCSW